MKPVTLMRGAWKLTWKVFYKLKTDRVVSIASKDLSGK